MARRAAVVGRAQDVWFSTDGFMTTLTSIARPQLAPKSAPQGKLNAMRGSTVAQRADLTPGANISLTTHADDEAATSPPRCFVCGDRSKNGRRVGAIRQSPAPSRGLACLMAGDVGQALTSARHADILTWRAHVARRAIKRNIREPGWV